MKKKLTTLRDVETGRAALNKFAKDNPSVGDADQFDQILGSIVKGTAPSDRTSTAVSGADCSETQTHPDTSPDADGTHERESPR